jgi:hypothetical protein
MRPVSRRVMVMGLCTLVREPKVVDGRGQAHPVAAAAASSPAPPVAPPGGSNVDALTFPAGARIRWWSIQNGSAARRGCCASSRDASATSRRRAPFTTARARLPKPPLMHERRSANSLGVVQTPCRCVMPDEMGAHFAEWRRAHRRRRLRPEGLSRLPAGRKLRPGASTRLART